MCALSGACVCVDVYTEFVLKTGGIFEYIQQRSELAVA